MRNEEDCSPLISSKILKQMPCPKTIEPAGCKATASYFRRSARSAQAYTPSRATSDVCIV